MNRRFFLKAALALPVLTVPGCPPTAPAAVRASNYIINDSMITDVAPLPEFEIGRWQNLRYIETGNLPEGYQNVRDYYRSVRIPAEVFRAD